MYVKLPRYLLNTYNEIKRARAVFAGKKVRKYKIVLKYMKEYII